MRRTDVGLQFWLRYIENAGGLWEDAGEHAIVVLPDSLRGDYAPAGDMAVTVDPDVAREEGATLLLAGHPVLIRAAETVLDEGDCGLGRLPRPPNPAPDAEQLLATAREQFPVDHGRIDAVGGVGPGVRPILRVGALVTFTLSSDVHFQEQMECWVDVPSCLELPGTLAGQLSRLVDDTHGERGARLPSTAELAPALRHAHEQIDRRAGEREADLSRQVGDEQSRETERAVAYYDEALRSLQRRLDSATPERAETLSARMTSTHAERDRRLGEIAEKYRATHTIRPFRLHVLGVPVLRLPVDVRRGDRRYPLTLEWFMPGRTFAGIRCPSCGSAAPLVAAKTQLGCERCLTKPDSQREAPRTPSIARESAAPSPPRPTVMQRPRRRLPDASATAMTEGRSRPSRQAIGKASRKLGDSLWELTTAGDRRVRRLYAPHSPAAAMHELFGPTAGLRAIGLGPGEQPLSMTSSEPEPAPGDTEMLIVSGEINTSEYAYGYQLCWRFTDEGPLIEELTPFEAAFWPRQPDPRYLVFNPAARRLYETMPEPRLSLDPVADALWHRAVPTHGLPLVLRGMAAWWRLQDPDRLLAARPPGALAAAITRMVAYRAGAGGRYEDAAAIYRVDVTTVREASADLQRRLRLSATCPW